MRWLFLLFGVTFLLASEASSRGGVDGSELAACQEKFSELGFSEQQTWDVSDRKVLEVCGSLPRYTINRVWHINRNQAPDAPSRGVELIQCEDAFESAGLSREDVLTASDAQLIQICETVPDLLD